MDNSSGDDKNIVHEGYVTLGERIRDLRMTKGLTQTQVAEGIITPSMMSQIETGKALPSYATIAAIARKLETPLSSLFEGLSFNKMQLLGYKLAMSHMAMGSYRSALPVLQELFEAEHLDDEIQLNELKLNLAICCRETKNFHEAIRLIMSLVDEYSRSSKRSDQHKLVHLHLHLSETFENNLMYFEALRSALNARDTYELQKNDPLLEGKILMHLADLNKRLHRFEEANAYYKQALEVCNQLTDNVEELGILYQRMAELQYAVGEPELCIDLANKAIGLLQEAGRITNYRETKRLIVMEQANKENWQDSIAVLLKMATMYAVEDPQKEAGLYLDVAQIYMMVQNFEECQVFCLKALGLLTDIEQQVLTKYDMTTKHERKQQENFLLIGRANLLMASVYLHRQEHGRVIHLLETAIPIFKQQVRLDELYTAASLLTKIVKNGEKNEQAWELITGCHDFLFVHLRRQGIL
ncbi:helix-turn-helix transcriptional regulator [Tumebacillus sp. ITR2]|uniref:Helix-turn-helix transcriptional regulator n=1 Tax=Tumebacillus amylolyticus TaxID=2801339 RepID=A0ABS1J7U3_9BACL|nr:helix-turn-helix transcriptional regulator [Tumebacillus amylolyticus]MBL0386334.1 helix-turn-helix transcriptional regulator [Tumebacillus amylolyticus]